MRREAKNKDKNRVRAAPTQPFTLSLSNPLDFLGRTPARKVGLQLLKHRTLFTPALLKWIVHCILCPIYSACNLMNNLISLLHTQEFFSLFTVFFFFYQKQFYYENNFFLFTRVFFSKFFDEKYQRGSPLSLTLVD